MREHEYKFNEDLIKNSRYSKFQDFHNLMRFRIQDIILVSSLYDSYIFEEDGRLYELIRKEYQGLNLSHSPELIHCSSGKEAIALAKKEDRFNLIITTLHVEDMHAINLAEKVKKAGLNIPVVLLGYDNRDMIDLISQRDLSMFQNVFIWQGNFRVILGIIKYLEDLYNVENDTNSVGVQVIILIEDNVRFYSSYLPLIYSEVLKQSHNLLSEGLNISHRLLRMRARPKILLCTTYESAWKYYKKYQENVLGIISDIDFMRKGKQDPQAGIKFTKRVRKEHPDIPILLQSNVPDNKKIAHSIGASFLLKDSPTLLNDLQRFMIQNFSFGDFIFRNLKEEEVGRAKNLAQLEKQLKIVPEESIVFHAQRNHFSNWLKARTEFWLAHKLRPRKVSDYQSAEELREDLIDSLNEFRTSRKRGVILDFDKDSFDIKSTFARIGSGSLGGKARGLGFVNNLLSNFGISEKFKNVEIFVPPSVVIGTEVFDKFVEDNNLRGFALTCNDDEEIIRRFLHAEEIPYHVIKSLHEFLELIHEPIAVRSSSLLEDSQGQPFAGVYDTIMLPNNHHEIKVRLLQLLNAIKIIYASTYCQKSKDYIQVTTCRLEEEKMAVIVQKMVGANHGNKFYPEFSGVARSHNFYPTEPLRSTDGIVSSALGLGRIITEGGSTVRFCPKYPHHLMQFSTVENTLKYSQQEFFALNLDKLGGETNLREDLLISKYNMNEADKDGIMEWLGSTYSHENHQIYDGVSRDGTRLFTLAPILKYRVIPLPEIVELLLEMGSWGMGSPVEIEFAVNLSVPKGKPKEFSLLQMRPLVISNEFEELDVDGFVNDELICKSDQVLGNGVTDNICDILFVDKDSFNRSKSNEVALELSQLNSKIISEGRRYLLIGVGRWGTLDPWLGIPVTWEQISGAQAIIESNFKDFNVTLSQGSHFFQNLTSFKVGYFTVNDYLNQGFIDWNWLTEQEPVETRKYTRHVRTENPLIVKISGRENKGVILKPSSN